MTTREFIAELQRKLDNAVVTKKRGPQIIATFVAPNSGFAGPRIRPRYLGDTRDGQGRYGLSRNQVERILTMFKVTLPPKTID